MRNPRFQAITDVAGLAVILAIIGLVTVVGVLIRPSAAGARQPNGVLRRPFPIVNTTASAASDPEVAFIGTGGTLNSPSAQSPTGCPPIIVCTPIPTLANTPIQTQPSTPSPIPTMLPTSTPINWGDADCNGAVESVDALYLLWHVAALPLSLPCVSLGEGVLVNREPGTWGDNNCDGVVDSVDALYVLWYVAGLSVSQNDRCPSLGESVDLLLTGDTQLVLGVSPAVIPLGQPTDVNFTANAVDPNLRLTSAQLYRFDTAEGTTLVPLGGMALSSSGAFYRQLTLDQATDDPIFVVAAADATDNTGNIVHLASEPRMLDVVSLSQSAHMPCQALSLILKFLWGAPVPPLSTGPVPFIPFVNFSAFRSPVDPNRSLWECDDPGSEQLLGRLFEEPVPSAVAGAMTVGVAQSLTPTPMPTPDPIQIIIAAMNAIGTDNKIDPTDEPRLEVIKNALDQLRDPTELKRLGVPQWAIAPLQNKVIAILRKLVLQLKRGLRESPGAGRDYPGRPWKEPLIRRISWRKENGTTTIIQIDLSRPEPLKFTVGLYGTGVDIEIWGRKATLAIDQTTNTLTVTGGTVVLEPTNGILPIPFEWRPELKKRIIVDRITASFEQPPRGFGISGWNDNGNIFTGPRRGQDYHFSVYEPTKTPTPTPKTPAPTSTRTPSLRPTPTPTMTPPNLTPTIPPTPSPTPTPRPTPSPLPTRPFPTQQRPAPT